MSPKSESTEKTVLIRAEPIELAQLLKFAGIVESGGMAKQLITEGEVELNGVVETQKGKKIRAGDRVTCNGQTLRVALG